MMHWSPAPGGTNSSDASVGYRSICEQNGRQQWTRQKARLGMEKCEINAIKQNVFFALNTVTPFIHSSCMLYISYLKHLYFSKSMLNIGKVLFLCLIHKCCH